MAQPPIVPTSDVARKFLALVEQSRANVAELYDSGRWKQYYTEAELLAYTRSLAGMHEMWSRVAALGGDGLPALRREPARSDASRRDATPAQSRVRAIR
jgi:hypothetical protein